MKDKPGQYKYIVATTKRELGIRSYELLDIEPDELEDLDLPAREAIKHLLNPKPRHNLTHFSWEDSHLSDEVLRRITETNVDDENFILSLGSDADAHVILIIADDFYRFVRDVRPGRVFNPEAQWYRKNFFAFHNPGFDLTSTLEGSIKHRTEVFFEGTLEEFAMTAVVMKEEELEDQRGGRIRTFILGDAEEVKEIESRGTNFELRREAGVRSFNAFFNWGTVGASVSVLGGWVHKNEMIYLNNGKECGFIENELSTFLIQGVLGMSKSTPVQDVLSFIRNCTLNINPENIDKPFDERWPLFENALNLYGDGAVHFLMNILRQKGLTIEMEGTGQWFFQNKGWHFSALIDEALKQ